MSVDCDDDPEVSVARFSKLGFSYVAIPFDHLRWSAGKNLCSFGDASGKIKLLNNIIVYRFSTHLQRLSKWLDVIYALFQDVSMTRIRYSSSDVRRTLPTVNLSTLRNVPFV